MTIEHIPHCSLCKCLMLRHGAWTEHWPKTVCSCKFGSKPVPKVLRHQVLICQLSMPGCTLQAAVARLGTLSYPTVLPPQPLCHLTRQRPGLGDGATNTACVHTSSLATALWCPLVLSAESFTMPQAMGSLCCALRDTVFLEPKS